MAVSGPAVAATYSLSVNVSNIYSPDFSLHPYSNPGTGSSYAEWPVPGAGIWTYQVDVYISVRDLGPDQRGLGSLSMNIYLPSRVTQNATVPGWQPDYSLADTNGPVVGGGVPLWATNQDAGGDDLDLRGIVLATAVVVSPSPYDLRTKIGQPTGPTAYSTSILNCVNATGWPDGRTYIGSVFLDLDSKFNQTVLFDLTYAAYQRASDGWVVTDDGAVLQDAMLVRPIPEPSALSTLALAAVPALRCRRRVRSSGTPTCHGVVTRPPS